MSKTDKKHIFTTFDSVSVIALIVSTVVLVGSIVSHAMIDQKQKLAQKRSEQLAIQIAAGGYRGLQDEALSVGLKDRSPASYRVEIKPEGRIGMDPWGSPYYYTLVETGSGDRIVTVLTSGPNRQRESFVEPSQNQHEKENVILRIKGDDLVASIKR